MLLFTIYDRISEKSGNIFACSTLGEAERQFHDALKNSDEGSLFRTHPQDFSLHAIGDFDEKSIKIINSDTFEVCKGKPLLAAAPA